MVLVIGFGCTSEDDGLVLSETNYLIFGHFYGECGGEGCVETYKLTDSRLYEDTLDDYSGQNLNFIPLEAEVFEQIKDLGEYFPAALRSSDEAVLGCPDCADGGGLFIQISENGRLRSWRIDQVKRNVPTYLHPFMDRVNDNIRRINQ